MASATGQRPAGIGAPGLPLAMLTGVTALSLWSATYMMPRRRASRLDPGRLGSACRLARSGADRRGRLEPP
jgi:hypothetical protein